LGEQHHPAIGTDPAARPPSKAAVIFLRSTAGTQNPSR
jgi:hypothetical protein